MNSLQAEPNPRDGDELTLRAPVGSDPMLEWQPEGAPAQGVDVLRQHDEPAFLSTAAPGGRPFGVWLLMLAVLAAGAGAAYFFVKRQGTAVVAPSTAASAPATIEAQPLPARALGGDVTPVDLPPLDQSDPVIRGLVNALSSHPRVVAWLATPGLIRNFTVVVDNIAEGKTPAQHLKALGLSSPYRVTGGPKGLVGDPRNHHRYDALAAGVASIDPVAAARLYASIKPGIEEAYAELGHEDMPFDRALERAIVVLLETPAPDAAPALTRAPKGVGYRFASPQMEALPNAQKQLLRAGPDNVRAVQSWLRAVASALGIPEERLPARHG